MRLYVILTLLIVVHHHHLGSFSEEERVVTALLGQRRIVGVDESHEIKLDMLELFLKVNKVELFARGPLAVNDGGDAGRQSQGIAQGKGGEGGFGAEPERFLPDCGHQMFSDGIDTVSEGKGIVGPQGQEVLVGGSPTFRVLWIQEASAQRPMPTSHLPSTPNRCSGIYPLREAPIRA